MNTHSHQRPQESADVQSRQDPLCDRYREAPDEAQITDWARTTGGTDLDAFHGRVNLGRSVGGASLGANGAPDNEGIEYDVEWPVGIHRAVGGDHDLPNPGNILCAALASCLDSTIRMIADRLGVQLAALKVEVAAHADVRGTLVVDRDVPVEFQLMECKITLEPAIDTNPRLLKKLIAAAEYSCVNLQTLRSGVPVQTRLQPVAVGEGEK